MTNPAYEAALAGGAIDTATGIPKSREEMFEFYEFIRKQTRDAESKAGEGGLEFPAGYMFKDPVQISPDQVKQFAALFPNNARPIQRKNHRFLIETM